MSQYDPKFDLRINVGHCYLYFTVQWFCLIAWRLFKNLLLLNETKKINCQFLSFNSKSFSCKKKWNKRNLNGSKSARIHLPIVLAEWLFNSELPSLKESEIMSRYDLTFDLKINVGHCDLYFMVQWFCLISPSLFDGWVSYFQIMRQCDPNFDLKINIGQHVLYFMVQWFCFIP